MTWPETGLYREMTHTPAMQFKMFQTRNKSWDNIFRAAADFSRSMAAWAGENEFS